MSDNAYRLVMVVFCLVMALAWNLVGGEHGAAETWGVGGLILANMPMERK